MKLTPEQRVLRLQIIFAFMVIYALLLFGTRPEPTQGQVVFRVLAALVGITGFAIVSTRRRR